jgi:hypothetical protein
MLVYEDFSQKEGSPIGEGQNEYGRDGSGLFNVEAWFSPPRISIPAD